MLLLVFLYLCFYIGVFVVVLFCVFVVVCLLFRVLLSFPFFWSVSDVEASLWHF